VLTGDEEKAYLDKILKDRTIKCQKVHKKQRGRDKLLKKANKLIANHKRFDE
jgi:La-related protein 7